MHIPFEIDGTRGYLNVMDKTFPPQWFHVMARKKDGDYFYGQLLLNPTLGWWLPDSPLEKHAARLGEIVEAWCE